MHLTEEELKQIVKEELTNLINEDEIDEKLFSALKNIGKGLLSKASNVFSTKPQPNKSQGVGRAFARYQVPQKQPTKQEPQQKPTTALAIRPSSAIGEPQISEPDTERADYVHAFAKKPAQLPAGEVPQQEFEPFASLNASQKQQLLLSEPIKIGVVDKVGDLLDDIKGEAFNNLFGRYSGIFKGSDSFRNLSPEQKQQTDAYINTILKHLISTDRILKNPTFTVIPPEETQKNVTEQSIPSVRQIQKDSSVFDTYIVKTLIHSMKQKFNYIPPIIIEAIVESLHEDGRLAISTRMYNQLKHTDDPRLKGLRSENIHIEESKSYSSFYNNWKKYTAVKNT